MSGEQKDRDEPDGKEEGVDSSLNATASKKALERALEVIPNRSEADACTNDEVTVINNQLSDDSLEDDVVPDDPVVTNVARDDKVVNGNNNTGAEGAANGLTEIVNECNTIEPTSDIVSDSVQNEVTNTKVSLDANGESSVTSLVTDKHTTNSNVKKDVSKATISGGSLQDSSIKSLQASSNSSCQSKIPLPKGSRGKPSSLLGSHKASMASVTMTTTGENQQNKVNSLQASENRTTPVSVALEEIPSFDSLHQDVNRADGLSNKQKETAVTIQAYYRGWNAQKGTKPSHLPGTSLYVLGRYQPFYVKELFMRLVNSIVIVVVAMN